MSQKSNHFQGLPMHIFPLSYHQILICSFWVLGNRNTDRQTDEPSDGEMPIKQYLLRQNSSENWTNNFVFNAFNAKYCKMLAGLLLETAQAELKEIGDEISHRIHNTNKSLYAVFDHSSSCKNILTVVFAHNCTTIRFRYRNFLRWATVKTWVNNLRFIPLNTWTLPSHFRWQFLVITPADDVVTPQKQQQQLPWE